MDHELLKILSEELRETRNLVIETRRMADETRDMVVETRKMAEAAQRTADDARRKADASWEFVIMTKNQIQEELRYLRLPWWKKLAGKAA